MKSSKFSYLKIQPVTICNICVGKFPTTKKKVQNAGNLLHTSLFSDLSTDGRDIQRASSNPAEML